MLGIFYVECQRTRLHMRLYLRVYMQLHLRLRDPAIGVRAVTPRPATPLRRHAPRPIADVPVASAHVQLPP
ncbi:MAG TPA: hypothetical protein PK929_19450, partial [Quisquiliibacterium sp.]|nr:hypothetical protein [Quisquiliibacterium sp.]